jgi:hypothetical protein
MPMDSSDGNLLMAEQVQAYEFTDAGFVVGSDAVVCIAPLDSVLPYMTLDEIGQAFSGFASYRQTPRLTRYVGVWGRRNCRRLRRFLRERGADLVLHRRRPPRLRLTSYRTHKRRARIRLLSQLEPG